MAQKSVQIEDSWYQALKEVFDQSYFSNIKDTLYQAKESGKVIYPPGPLIFNAFNLTPFDKIKVVILGQDPYHNPGEAMGLCFSVPRDKKIPPSLRNVYKELATDIKFLIPQHGDLTHWAHEGVFLLNAILTVEAHKPASHSKIGWQDFTDAVIRVLSAKKENLVFMLWGRFAHQKESLIDTTRHLVLKAAHPSPLAGGAYFGSKHFSQANAYLSTHNQKPIHWQID